LAIASSASASESDDITAVSSRTSSDYVRTRLADGSFAPETYAFARGGEWKGAKQDASMDKVPFLDIAHPIARALASQDYIPSRDPNATKLLIMVYWGTTHAPEEASNSAEYENLQADQGNLSSRDSEMAGVVAENRMRYEDDVLNARMLGYDSWWAAAQGDTRGTALENDRQELMSEIEEDRYFVVLMAYDFQLLWKDKQRKLLWEARFSIPQRGHNFDEDLPAMAQYASLYFGQDSHGLIHKEIPLGHVEIGDLKSLGAVPERPATDTVQPPAKR
jgi:hypothetical protein